MFRKRLKSRRIQVGLSVKQVASELGITIQAYTYWENGTNEPDIKHLVPLSDLLRCSTDYLIHDPIVFDKSSIEYRLYKDIKSNPIPNYMKYLYLYFDFLVRLDLISKRLKNI